MKPDLDSLFPTIERIVQEIGVSAGDVIPILHAVQKEYNYLPEEALRRVCELTEVTPASITGISTFYSQFRHTPVGQHIIHICTGTACHMKGAERVYDAFCRELSIPDNHDTDPEGMFTLQRVACLGCCTIAPVVQIDQVTYGHVQTDGIAQILQDFLKSGSREGGPRDGRHQRAGDKGEIRIGLGSCCVASGSQKVQQALEECVEEIGIDTQVKRVGCVGMCHRTPLLEVHLPDEEPILYDKVQPEDVKKIVLKHYRPRGLKQRFKNSAFGFIESLFLDDSQNGFSRHPLHFRDPNIEAFLGRQVSIATEFFGEIDPLDLSEYRSRGGFAALETCLTQRSPENIIQEINTSGLRGRGGAGFPTGRKWDIVRSVADDKKYIICNGDEGDPGAFMDRMILESYPFRVIEGMAIAAYAVGAHEGYLLYPGGISSGCSTGQGCLGFVS